MWKRYLEGLQTSHEKKSAITVLKDIVYDGHKEICDDILSLALERGRSDPEHIRQCYITMSKPEMKPEPMRDDFDSPFFEYAPDLSSYDRLAGGVGV